MMHRNLLAILFTVVLMTSCTPGGIVGRPSDPGEALFARAERNFRSAAYRKALSDYDAYLTRYPGGVNAPTVLFRKGEIYRGWKDYRTARENYQQLIDTYGGSDLAAGGMAGILQTLYAEGRYRDVIRHADAFLRRPGGIDRPAPIFFILGNTYMALDSPANAVYFYAKAHELVPPPRNTALVQRLKASVDRLSREEILALSERVTDEDTRGYLVYALGKREVDEQRYGDAARTFSQFAAAFPRHEYTGEAKRMAAELEGGRMPAAGDGSGAVGCLLPLSGTYEHYGKKALRAIELAVGEAGAAGQVRLVVKDTHSDADRAAAAVLEMDREGVSAIIGPIITAEAAALKAQEIGIPIIVMTQKPDIALTGDYVFRHFLTPQMQARTLVSHAMEMMGIRRFAVLYPEEKYGTVFLETFREEVRRYGGDVVATSGYAVNQSDFGEAIKPLLRYGGIEALFIPDGPDNAGLIIPQLVYHGVSGVQLMGTNLWNSEKLIRAAGRYAQGAIFPEIFYPDNPRPEVQEFVQMYSGHFGEPPGFIEALAYDTAMMLMDAFRSAGSENRQAVRDAISGIRFAQGVTGSTMFDESGDAVKPLDLLKIEGDHFESMGPWQPFQP